jgi:pimeloyl-ACP methyl ester carboxylesterase
MSDATRTTKPPTVLLVHGAFADGSSWARVIKRLQDHGVQVRAIANPLRGLAADSDYVASVIDQIDGPVLAVGHSYGGAVITNAVTKANAAMPNHVVGLVYVAAFAPEEGETVAELVGRSRVSALGHVLIPRDYPTGPDAATATELTIDPTSFRDVVAADLPSEEAAVLGAAQRPIADAANVEQSGPPAWRDLPAWAIVATADRAAGSDEVRSMAERAGADTVEIEGSHLIMISQPEKVTEHILKAVRAVGGANTAPALVLNDEKADRSQTPAAPVDEGADRGAAG